MHLKNFDYHVVSRTSPAPEISLIELKAINNSLHYEAGQYIKIIQPDGTFSPLSIGNAPNKSASIELHLSHSADNLKAIALANMMLPNKKIILCGPYGKCTIKKLEPNLPIIFIARVTGFAPIKAIIEQLIQSKQYPAMHLYWGATNPADFYLLSLVKQWEKKLAQFHFTPVLTGSLDHHHWQGKIGLLQDKIVEDYPDLRNFQVYASGPPALIYDSLEVFMEHGLQKQRFISDVFDYNAEI